MAESAKQAKRRRQREARKRRQEERRSLLGGCRQLQRAPSPPVELDWDSVESMTGYLETCEREYSKAIYPIVRLTDEGVDWGTIPKEGDEIGFGMHPYRTDDCLRPAIATVTQVPIEEVPDLRLDERAEAGDDPDTVSAESWAQIEGWAESHGLKMSIWDVVPVPRRRWIGVRVVEDGLYDHCLVMTAGTVLFDPACSVKLPPGHRLEQHTADTVSYGISFENKEE